jgi:ribosomal protein S18 acetylase RimI-like enzyme
VREFHSTAIREIFTMIRSGELEGWLAETPMRAVGCACVVFWRRLPYADGNLHAEISGVYVEPELRRFGIATELVREAVGSARSRGARNVTLTPKENSRAMYERLGFVDCDRMLLNLSSQAAARTAASPLE